MNKVVIVEDDVRLAKLISDYLTKHGFTTIIEHRGDSAIYRITKEQPDLVVLDLALPKIDGLTVCKEVRQYYDGLILILTATVAENTEIESLEIGADDYLKKPVNPGVLLAHIKALLRRKDKAILPIALIFGSLKIDPGNQTVYWHNAYIDLSRKEFELFYFLANHAGKVVNRDNISQALKGFEHDITNRTIDMTISSLRKKFDDEGRDAKRIKTIWGKGYLFVAEDW